MSIETTGQIEAEDFKTNQSVTAGFVKNTASGDFEFGQSATGWDLIEAKEVTTNLNSGAIALTFSGLNGEVDDTYQLVFNGRYNDAAGAGGSGVGLAATGLRFLRLGINGLVVTPFLARGKSVFRNNIHFFNGSGGHSIFIRNTVLEIGFAVSTGGFADFHGRIIFSVKHGTTGNLGNYTGQGSTMPVDPLNAAALTQMFGLHFAGFWNDASTNVTSLNIEVVGQETVVLGSPASSWYLYKIKK